MSAVVEVHDLSKNFGNFHAVSGLSFTVPSGKIYGFLGQNGAGKSTTIRMLLTLITPTAGTIRIFGMDLRTHRAQILRRVGAIIERPDLYKYLTALENLKLFAAMSGLKPTRAALMEQLELVGLAERAESKVRTFSQGMKQRLGIATALVHNPDLIILDEPTNGLDPQGIADIRNLILHLSRDRQKTLVVSSHLLSEMEVLADSMLIIDKGKKVVEGTVAELFDPLETIIELKTLDNNSSLAQIKQSSLQRLIVGQKQDHILLKAHKDAIHDILAQLMQMGIPVISYRSKNSLEDYFLSLTSGNQHVEPFKA